MVKLQTMRRLWVCLSIESVFESIENWNHPEYNSTLEQIKVIRQEKGLRPNPINHDRV